MRRIKMILNTTVNTIKTNNTVTNPNTVVKTHVFPCKSINLTRFIKSKGIMSEYKFTDAQDNKDCWIFLRTSQLEDVLKEWHDTKPTIVSNKY